MTAGSKIAFFYPSYYPVTGGSSVHGYNLAKELTNHGYQLTTFTELPDGFTNHRSRSSINVLTAIIRCDLVYVRIGTGGISRYIPQIAKLFGKKVIAEVNGPADELAVTKSKNDIEVKKADAALSKILRRADAVITVSALMGTYCSDVLKHRNVHVIENGGERFEEGKLQLTEKFKTGVMKIRSRFHKIVIWSGTIYPWQGFGQIKQLIDASPVEIAFIIVSNDKKVWEAVENKLNVFCFEKLTRDETAFLILTADTGLALYGDFSWSRFGEFHGSSLKYYEYLANGLCVVASPTGHLKQAASGSVLVSANFDEMVKFILSCSKQSEGNSFRSWKDVALDTSNVIRSIQ